MGPGARRAERWRYLDNKDQRIDKRIPFAGIAIIPSKKVDDVTRTERKLVRGKSFFSGENEERWKTRELRKAGRKLMRNSEAGACTCYLESPTSTVNHWQRGCLLRGKLSVQEI